LGGPLGSTLNRSRRRIRQQQKAEDMRTTAKERGEVMHRLAQLGIGYYDAEQLRRIAMTLHRWFEMECGDGRGCIERDETTNKPYWLNSDTMSIYTRGIAVY
jgi:hypothetical protein